MKLPKKQKEKVRNKDIRVAEYVGQLIAVRLRGLGEGTTKYSEGEVKPHADVALWTIDVDAEDTYYVGETRVFQTYLVEAFSDADNDWVVGRIVKGDRAFLFHAPDENELAACEKAVGQLG